MSSSSYGSFGTSRDKSSNEQVKLWLDSANYNKTECHANSVAVGSLLSKYKKIDQEYLESKSLKCMKKNHASGCSSLLNIARVKSKFNPFVNCKNTEEDFKNFVEQLSSCPFFSLVMSEEINVEKKDCNWDGLVNSIVDLYDGVRELDKSQIKNSIVNLVKSASSKLNTVNSQKLFFHNTIRVDKSETAEDDKDNWNNNEEENESDEQVLTKRAKHCCDDDEKMCDDDGEIVVYLYNSYIQTIHSKDKRIDSRESKVCVKKAIFKFNTSMWEENYEMIKDRNIYLISDWINESAIAEETVKSIRLSCFDMTTK